MDRNRRTAVYLAIGLLLTGCASGAAPSPSPADPRPTETRSASIAPSPLPSATATQSVMPVPPTVSPVGSSTTTPSMPATPDRSTAAVVEVTIGTPRGNATRFVPDAASVPARARVRLTFENRSSVPHNVTFGPPIDARTDAVVPPDDSDTTEFSAPAAGSYEFVCTLHPWMTGTLEVTAAP